MVDVEWLILADAAEVVGGKLYLMGGGWDVLTANSALPLRRRCAIAAAFRIPWNETNLRHDITIEVVDEDGRRLMETNGQIEVGRPPGLVPGLVQRSQLTLDVELQFDHLGTYVIIARVEGQEDRRVPFTIVPGPLMTLQQPGGGPP